MLRWLFRRGVNALAWRFTKTRHYPTVKCAMGHLP
jgi:hypothetical protein